jgi:hypothetical protein
VVAGEKINKATQVNRRVMSIKLVKEEIGKFLAHQEPEVLCIRGKWGVGKTYTWAKELETAQRTNAVKLPRYSYVSLFGVNSLEELKFAVFENVITLSDGLERPIWKHWTHSSRNSGHGESSPRLRSPFR